MAKVIPRESRRITYSSEIRALKLVPFSSEQLSIVKGSLLGDGCLHTAWPGTSKNYVFSKMHSIKQKEYIYWVYEKMQPFVRQLPRPYEPTQSIRLRTISHSELTTLMSLFYRDGKKILPLEIENFISDSLVLAVWFMDDGNIVRREGQVKGYHLNTQSFGLAEHERLIEAFGRIHGIHANIEKNNRYYRLSIFQRASREKFHDLVSQHVIPSMQYKLG
ncbi:MAG TPA: hypothetical protein VI483_01745 [Candidatus Paceibacterota bacterium]